MTVSLIPEYQDDEPNRDQSAPVFSNNADDWLSYQVIYIPDMNVSIAEFNIDTAGANALNESTATLANTIVNASNFKGEWDSATGAETVPSTYFNDGMYWQLLVPLADITLSEPAFGNTDWALSPQVADRALIQSPFTLTITGKYHILGSGTVILPDPSTLADGQVFNFTKEPNETPTIFGGVNLITTRLGLTDDIFFTVSQIEFIVRSGLYQV